MQQRNWLSLGRKLVDQYDMDATVQWIQQALGYYALSYFGFGVQKTTYYPNPFPITTSGSDLTGAVGAGVAYDPNGQLISVPSSLSTSQAFAIPAADTAQPRWDLLVINYKQTGSTLIPKPSDPLSNVYLNLNDDFEIDIREGTPSSTPSYPTKTAGDVILAGIRVPANAANAAACTVDLGIREYADGNITFAPVFRQVKLTGVTNGANNVFMLPSLPLNPGSLVLFVDALKQDPTDYNLSGQTVTMTDPPDYGQVVTAFYIEDSPQSTNPLSGMQEVPVEIPNGVNDTFTLTGLPADQASTIVFVDGLKEPVTNWDLIQGVTNGEIKFHSDSIPDVGTEVSVFYFVNPATVGTGGSSGGGGGTSPVGTTPETYYPVLSPTDITNGFVVLPLATPVPTKTMLDVIGGSAQIYSTDFTVAGNILTFSAGLGALVGAGDTLRILYWT